jgi:uncharacterized RDD family membrane protein YckC
MASADYSVLTPERVSLEYGIAGIGSRAGAAIIDTLIQLVALVVVAAAGTGAGAAASLSSGRFVEVIVIAVVALGAFAITVGYFMVFEIVWNGQTPGKRILGIRVIRESGYPIQAADSVVRNLVRIVDWLPLFYGIGVLVMLFNKRSKRLGDFAAGTLVVREGGAPLTLATSVSTGYTPGYTPVSETPAAVLSSADATLVRDFLVRRDSLHPTARADLAQRLAAAMARRYHVPLEGEPEAFLERLAA